MKSGKNERNIGKNQWNNWIGNGDVAKYNVKFSNLFNVFFFAIASGEFTAEIDSDDFVCSARSQVIYEMFS